MTNNRSHDDKPELSLDALTDVAGGTNPIKVVMGAYSAALKEMAAQQKDTLNS